MCELCVRVLEYCVDRSGNWPSHRSGRSSEQHFLYRKRWTNQKTGVWGAVSVGSVFMYLFMEVLRSHIDIYSNVIPPSSLL